MAKRPGALSGSSSDLVTDDRKFDDDKHYEVVLTGVVEYPPGSGRYLSPSQYVEVRGRILNGALRGKFKEAREAKFNELRFHAEGPAPRTNLTSVKSFKK